MFKFRCLLEAGDVPIEVLQPTMNIWVTIPDRLKVGLEQLFIAQDVTDNSKEGNEETVKFTVT
jgi:hypothetical protein